MDEDRVESLISVDPLVMGGKPVVRGTRLTVEHILEQLRYGHSIDDLVAAHPRLTRAGVQAAIDYALQAIRVERSLAAS